MACALTLLVMGAQLLSPEAVAQEPELPGMPPGGFPPGFGVPPGPPVPGVQPPAGPSATAPQETAATDVFQKERIARLRKGGPRDPFWPVGWQPPKIEDETVTPTGLPEVEPVKPADKWAEAEKRINLGGVGKNRQVVKGKEVERVYAIVNAEIMEVGDRFIVSHEGQKYEFQVRSIDATTKQVVIDRIKPEP